MYLGLPGANSSGAYKYFTYCTNSNVNYVLHWSNATHLHSFISTRTVGHAHGRHLSPVCSHYRSYSPCWSYMATIEAWGQCKLQLWMVESNPLSTFSLRNPDEQCLPVYQSKIHHANVSLQQRQMLRTAKLLQLQLCVHIHTQLFSDFKVSQQSPNKSLPSAFDATLSAIYAQPTVLKVLKVKCTTSWRVILMLILSTVR